VSLRLPQLDSLEKSGDFMVAECIRKLPPQLWRLKQCCRIFVNNIFIHQVSKKCLYSGDDSGLGKSRYLQTSQIVDKGTQMVKPDLRWPELRKVLLQITAEFLNILHVSQLRIGAKRAFYL